VTPTVEVTRHGHTVVVTINRPERRNALNAEVMGGIGVAFTDAETDDDIRVVVLTGAGDRAFCAGGDLRDRGTPPPPGTPGLEVLTNRCYPKPVVCAVNGLALGGGFELAMASDIVIAADHASFGMPEVKRGLVGAGCSTRLSARVPPAIAYEMGFTGDPISVERAYGLGLVNEVVPGAELMERVFAMADRIAANAPLSLRVTKELMWQEMGMHDQAEWMAIRAKAAPVFASEDAREGAAAFAEKRPPVWTGR
jgi:enoyl-CoA hydratase